VLKLASKATADLKTKLSKEAQESNERLTMLQDKAVEDGQEISVG